MRPLTGAERAAVSCCPTRGGEAIVEDRGGGRGVGQARGQSVADGGEERVTDRGQRVGGGGGGRRCRGCRRRRGGWGDRRARTRARRRHRSRGRGRRRLWPCRRCRCGGGGGGRACPWGPRAPPWCGVAPGRGWRCRWC